MKIAHQLFSNSFDSPPTALNSWNVLRLNVDHIRCSMTQWHHNKWMFFSSPPFFVPQDENVARKAICDRRVLMLKTDIHKVRKQVWLSFVLWKCKNHQPAPRRKEVWPASNSDASGCKTSQIIQSLWSLT